MTTAAEPSGPTLVLIHGFPLDHEMWTPQAAGLAGSARVIAVDLPGFGGTPPAPFTIDSAADTVVEMLDAVGETAPVVVGGLSMGGYVAMAVARRHPARVAGLILADTRADADDDAAKANREKMIEWAKAKGAAGVAEAMLPKLLADATRADKPAVVELVTRLIHRQPVETIVRGLAALRDRPDAGPGLDAVTVPTLVLVGEHDAITPLTMAEAIGARVFGSQVVTIPAAGHMSNLENPEAFNAAVRAFLAAIQPTTQPATTSAGPAPTSG